MDKTLKTILCYVLAFSIVLAFTVVAAKYTSDKAAQEFAERLQETFDEVNRDRAIMELSELRGRIFEIKLLSYHHEIPSDVLQDELDDIISSQDFTNPYLTDFEFIIPYTSTVRELCDELISQIDDQIHTTEYGTEGA